MALRIKGLAIAALLALALPVKAQSLNIVAIGASNTSGWGVGEQNAYPAVLEALLRKKGIDAHVTNAGRLGDVTAGMRSRLDAVVPKGTDIVILQPGANDLRFFGTKEARGIRVIVYDPPTIPPDFYQWDHIHFNAAAHAKIAAILAAQIAASGKAQAAAPSNATPTNAAPTTATPSKAQ